MTPTEDVKYILGKEEYGIKYDFTKLRKEYKKLGCPKDVYDPTTCPLETAKYFVANSERNVGKTTNWLLFGMLMNKMYGTIIQYVRQTDNMVVPKQLKDLFSTILLYDYVSKITDGRWNSVLYRARRYYYCNVDPDSGQVVEKDTEHFMFCCSIDKAEDLKSSYNAPLGDLIIWDECIGKYYYPNEFVRFCDLVKTIIRGRRSPLIVLLANTIQPHSPLYNELEIYEQVQLLHAGDHELIETQKGTKIYLEWIGVTGDKKAKNTIVNKLFFGFKNTLLGSITGDDWAIKCYQHIPELPNDDENATADILSRRLYLFFNNKYVRLDLVDHYELGICIYAHWATRTYTDSIILTNVERTDRRFQYKLGEGNLSKFLKRMIETNRIYYASNDIGTFTEAYLSTISKL